LYFAEEQRIFFGQARLRAFGGQARLRAFGGQADDHR
jgi:hypothetical protein